MKNFYQRKSKTITKLFSLLAIVFLLFNCESNNEIEEIVNGSRFLEISADPGSGGGSTGGGSTGGVGYTSTTSIWTSDYVYNSGWRVDKHPRLVADVNGDGRADIISFGNNNVTVSLSKGSSFLSGKNWFSGNFCENHNYRTYLNPRHVADVNGDGKSDLVVFGDDDVFVALSDGEKFLPGTSWYRGYGIGNLFIQNWVVEKNPRILSDVNGDGKADIIAFGNNDVWVSLSNGISFQAGQIWRSFEYVENRNWKVDENPRTIADVNGDGKGDIVAFGDNDIWVSLSNGTSFGNGQVWRYSEYVENQNWRVDRHPRMLCDVNGDGKADVVGFGNYDVWVSLSNGTSFGNGQVWYNGYGFGGTSFGFIPNNKWEVSRNPRLTNDVDGDGKGDIIGFGDNDVWVTTSKF